MRLPLGCAGVTRPLSALSGENGGSDEQETANSQPAARSITTRAPDRPMHQDQYSKEVSATALRDLRDVQPPA
jgi:hypothetical protein